MFVRSPHHILGCQESKRFADLVGQPARALSLADVTPGHGHPSRGVSGPVSPQDTGPFVGLSDL